MHSIEQKILDLKNESSNSKILKLQMAVGANKVEIDELYLEHEWMLQRFNWKF